MRMFRKVLAAVLAVFMIAAHFSLPQARAESPYSVRSDAELLTFVLVENTEDGPIDREESFHTISIRNNHDGSTKIAYCVEADRAAPVSWSDYSDTEVTVDQTAVKDAYYGYGYPGHEDEMWIAATQMAIWLDTGQVQQIKSIHYGGAHPRNAHTLEEYMACVDEIRELVKAEAEMSRRDVKEMYFVAAPAGTHNAKYQAVMAAGLWEQTGELQLKVEKKSSMSAVTDQNTAYSLQGASFSFYRDAACRELFYAMDENDEITDEQGVFTKSFGTYDYPDLNSIKEKGLWAVETKAPKGFELDSTPQKVDIIQNGKAFTIYHKKIDRPEYAPVKLRIIKKNALVAENPAPMSGAQFTICYYKNRNLEGKPARKWVIQTLETSEGQYAAQLGKKWLVKGDDLICDADGTALIPAGAITIEETKAPEGYTVDGQYTIEESGRQIAVPDQNGVAVLYALMNENKGTVELMRDNQPGGEIQKEEMPDLYQLSVQKLDGTTGKNEGQGGALDFTTGFILINDSPYARSVAGTVVPAGGSYAFTTDSEGVARVMNVERGSYFLKETSAPYGYILPADGQPVRIQLDGDHPEDHQVIVSVINYPRLYRLQVSKRDSETGETAQGDADLSGTFSVTNLNEHAVSVNGKTYQNGEVIMTFHTDAAGNYTSDRIFPYGRYLIREERPPRGYSARGFGSDHAEMDTLQEEVCMGGDQEIFTVQLTNDVIKGKFDLIKYSSEGVSRFVDPEEGVEFTAVLSSKIGEGKLFETFDDALQAIRRTGSGQDVIDAEGRPLLLSSEYAVLKTDSQGHAESGMLAYGTYEIRQTSHKEGVHDVIGSAYFTVSEENQPVKHYAAVNEKQDYYLRIVKKDKETGETITQHSASFKIYRIEGEKRIPVIQKVGLISFDTFTTNSEGKAVGIKGIFTHEYSSRGDEKGTVTTPLKLTAGEYEIEEVRSPYGYVKLDQPYRFTAGESNIAQTDEDHDSLVVVNAYDEKVSSGLEIVKKIKEYSADRSFVNRTDLSGFGFELFAAEDIEDPSSGEKIAEKGKHASVLTDTGFVETGVLYTDSSGHITLDALPFGHYILKETVQPEGIVPNTKEYAVDLTPQKDESRKEIRHTITIENDTTKLSVSKKDAAAEELPGAHMSLKNENGEAVDEWVSSQKPHVMEGLSAGKTYTLCEDLAPLGYTKVNDIPIVINMDGSVQKVNVVDKAMAVMKVDNCNTAVPGAQLAFFTADENGSPVGEALDRWVTDDKAHMVSDIEPGKKYVLVEEQAPAGYVKMKNRTFTLKDDAKDQTMKVKNTQVVISKEDVGGTELEGAVLTVVEKDTENMIDQWVSGCEKHLISGLEEGKTYTLKEDTAPLGYVKNSTVDFKVGSNDMEVVLIDTIERVAKVDNRGNTIKGVQLQAVDEAGNVIDTWRTGSHILDFSTEQKQSLQKGEMIAFVKEDGTSVRVQPTVKTGKKSIKAEKKSGVQKLAKEYCELKKKRSITEVDQSSLPQNSEYAYTAVIQETDGTFAYIDVDLNGDETEHRIRHLQAGQKYIVQETEGLNGYYYAEDAEVKPNDSSDHRTMMVDHTIHYQIAKVDDVTGAYVEGVRLELTDITDAENHIPVELPNGGITTDKPFDLDQQLIAGHIYELVESEYVAGYYQAVSLQFTVPLKGTSELTTITMRDVPTAVSVSKIDSSGKPVAGALLQLRDREGDILYEFVSSDAPEGVDISAYVKGGESYILHESEAPYGFDVTADIAFTVTGNPETHQIIVMEDARNTCYIAVEKQDAEHPEKKLAEAEFALYDGADQIVKDVNGEECIGITDENGELLWQVTFDGSMDGWYVKETKAPEGYQLNSEKFAVKVSKDYDFARENPIRLVVRDVIDEKPKLPNTSTEETPGVKTGVIDDTSKWFAILITGVCLFLIFLTRRDRSCH